jgi:ribosomal protein S27AE
MPCGKLTRTKAQRDRKNAKRRAERFKDQARDMVRGAIRKGELQRQPCERCGSRQVEAHHEDYGKPLDVQWLCRPHHREADLAIGVRAI